MDVSLKCGSRSAYPSNMASSEKRDQEEEADLAEKTEKAGGITGP
jgi:hypothetical protein